MAYYEAQKSGSGGSAITVDSALSTTSENPVQNKVIAGALDNKVDKVTGKGLSTNDYDNTAKTIVDSVTSNLNGKVDKVTGKGLSTNDYTAADKAIVDGVTTALSGKQDTLTAGDNITITGNVISATGGGGGSITYATEADARSVANGTYEGS